MKARQQKRRRSLRIRREVRGVMAQAWFYNRRGVLVKHVMRYASFTEYEQQQEQ